MQTQRTDLETIKAQFDLATVVEHSTGQQVGTRNIRCPFHADDSPSLHVWGDGRWKCFGCGKKGDVLDWVGYVLFGDAYNPGQHLKEVIDSLGALDIKPVAPQHKPRIEIKPTLDPALPIQWTNAMTEREETYWETRGIPLEITARFRVGWTGRRYSFPWQYRGVTTACKLRRDDDLSPDLEPKYISVEGSRYTAPYNIDHVIMGYTPDIVLIVEDEKSVMAAACYGLVAIAYPAGTWRSEWSDLLAYVPQTILVPDNDTAGLLHVEKIRASMRRSRIALPPVGKDLFDYHHSIVGQLDAKALIWRWLGLE